MNKKFAKASEVVDKILDGIVDKKISHARSISKIWSDAAGEKISEHSKVVDMRNGNLLVAVDHPGWSCQILFKKKEIIKRINDSLSEGQVRGIAFSIAPKSGLAEKDCFSGKAQNESCRIDLKS